MEITLEGNVYTIGKLNAIQQFHLARRLAPALWALGNAAQSASDKQTDAEALGAMGPVADVIAKMSDADSEYVLKACLGVVTRQQQTGWAKIQAASGNLMFDDINLPVMMQLTFAVVRENLGNFFNALPTQ